MGDGYRLSCVNLDFQSGALSIFFLIGICLLYNLVLVSAVQ